MWLSPGPLDKDPAQTGVETDAGAAEAAIAAGILVQILLVIILGIERTRRPD